MEESPDLLSEDNAKVNHAPQRILMGQQLPFPNFLDYTCDMVQCPVS